MRSAPTRRLLAWLALLPFLVSRAAGLPLSEDFADSLGPFTPVGGAAVAWSQDPVQQNLRVRVTAANTSAACTVPVPELGGPAATAKDFRLVARLRVDANTGADNTIGVGFLGSDASFTGSTPATSYYLADLRVGSNKIRLVRVTGTNVELIPTSTPAALTLTTGVAYTLTVTGSYNTGTLVLEFTVSNGVASQTFSGTDASPLTGTHFGLRPRTNSGNLLDARYDYFHLDYRTSLSFSTVPPRFAREGEDFAYLPAATNSLGQAASMTGGSFPGWLSLANGALSGRPALADAGVHPIHLTAADASGATAEQDFDLTVLPASLQGPILSEFMADNRDFLVDEDGDFPDWLELFNPSGVATNLSGWTLSDDPLQPARWTLPPGTLLEPHGFRVIFASAKNRTADPARLHTNFKLDAGAGHSLWLRRPDGSVASSLANTPAQRANIAFGVYGDYLHAGFLPTPSPGEPNPGVGYRGFVGDTRFSLPRGFYDSPQSAGISCDTPGAILVYTLDGSTPSLLNGIQVLPAGMTNAPSVTLAITGTTLLRASAFLDGYSPSGPDTQTYLFPRDVAGQSPAGAPPPGWPAGPVNGQVLDYGMDPDVVNAAGIGAVQAALTNLESVSIVTDLGNLLDGATGIYVNGYGREEGWERPCSVELLRPDGQPGFHINAGLRIRGGASRSAANPKHGFHLYFRSEYGEGRLHYPVFGAEGADEFNRLDLRSTQGTSWHNTGSANAVYTRDEWSRLTQRDLGQPYKRSRYYHLYLNGQYWGIYNADERADNDYAATYFGGPRENYDVVKTYVLPHRVLAADGDALAWNQLHAAATAGFATDAAYFAVQGLDASGASLPGSPPLVDVDNLIDYMLLCFYTGNTDGPVNPGAAVPKNFYAVRARDGAFGFRFFAHDFEDTFNGADVTGPNSTGATLAYFNPRWLHLRLADNARYRLRFADRAQRALFNGGALDTPSALARWRGLRAQLSGAILAESARWGDAKTGTNPPFTIAQWNSAHNTVESTTIPNRAGTLLGLLRTRALFPSINAPVFSRHGGALAPGQTVSLDAGGLSIFYTTDGRDPLDPGATAYAGPFAPTPPLQTVRARARSAGGEWSALTQATFTVGAVPAAAGNLVVSELHYHPAPPTPGERLAGFADDSDFEFVELLNIGGQPVDLSAVVISNAVAFSFAAAPDSARVLAPGGRVVVTSRRAAFAARNPGPANVAGDFTGNLANGGEVVTLLGAGGAVIESFAYGDRAPWPEAPDGSGPSLVYNQPFAHPDPNLPENWRPSAVVNGKGGLADAAAFPADPLGDADGDQRPDLLEYALGGEASVRAYQAAVGDYLFFSATRNLDADGFALVPERSSDLLTWQSPSFTLVSCVAQGDGTATLTWRSLAPAGPGTDYVRLRVQP